MLTIPPGELARIGLEAAPDAMIFIDASGTIRHANRQLSVLFGYPPDEIIGHGIEKLMPARFRARHIGHREGYVGNIHARPMDMGLDLFG